MIFSSWRLDINLIGLTSGLLLLQIQFGRLLSKWHLLLPPGKESQNVNPLHGLQVAWAAGCMVVWVAWFASCMVICVAWFAGRMVAWVAEKNMTPTDTGWNNTQRTDRARSISVSLVELQKPVTYLVAADCRSNQTTLEKVNKLTAYSYLTSVWNATLPTCSSLYCSLNLFFLSGMSYLGSLITQWPKLEISIEVILMTPLMKLPKSVSFIFVNMSP